MSKRLPVIWDAEPHTIAKIEILKSYLQAWFRILGKTRPGETILYVDGFSGPGYYKNHDEGSPLAAMRVASKALHSLNETFVASRLHCAFIESHPERFAAMAETIAPLECNPSIGTSKFFGTFVDGIKRIRQDVPEPFSGKGPLFIFADPFGGTEIPFETFAECMKSDTSELLINLDADGIARIFFAECNNGRDEQLNELFGGDCWRSRLNLGVDIKRLSVQILDLYKERLRTLPNVRFIWSFAMRGKGDALNYHLVFATKHPLGLEKMKEAMRSIDQTGNYSFSDAHVGQPSLFSADNTEVYAKQMFSEFRGKQISMEDASLFALNETPFTNAKGMLTKLQELGQVVAEAMPGEKLRAGTFPDGKVKSLFFPLSPIGNNQSEFLL